MPEEIKPPSIILNQSFEVVGTMNIPESTAVQPMMLEQLNNAALVNFAVMTGNIVTETGQQSTETIKSENQNFTMGNLKFEVNPDLNKDQIVSNNAFHTTYSSVPPTTTAFSHTETYNYQNFG